MVALAALLATGSATAAEEERSEGAPVTVEQVGPSGSAGQAPVPVLEDEPDADLAAEDRGDCPDLGPATDLAETGDLVEDDDLPGPPPRRGAGRDCATGADLNLDANGDALPSIKDPQGNGRIPLVPGVTLLPAPSRQ